jgi:DNA-binding response OmpR family regulator
VADGWEPGNPASRESAKVIVVATGGRATLALDTGRLAADAGGGPVPLTRLEFLLLRELASHAGQPVPKKALLAAVWGYDSGPVSNVVDACVRRLRSKLGFDLIKTVRGEGYQLAVGLPAPSTAQLCAPSSTIYTVMLAERKAHGQQPV